MFAFHDELRPIVLGWPGGIEAELLPFGARLHALRVPGRRGPTNVVLGYAAPAAYLEDQYFLGCTIGRTANRIAGARFHLDGRRYTLTANEGANHLHGGPLGLHKRVWTVLAVDVAARRVIFRYRSPDGEEGYPGTLEVRAIFEVKTHALEVTLEAQTDRTTPVDLTFHPYFNLSGHAQGTVAKHQLWVRAHEFLMVNAELIPTGERMKVAGTPLDFRRYVTLGERLQAGHSQLRLAGGIDHSFLLDTTADVAAELTDADSGLKMRLHTDQPCMQVYCGNHLGNDPRFPWVKFGGICLEPQGFPNAVNQGAFPGAWLKPGETYRNVMRYEFSSAD